MNLEMRKIQDWSHNKLKFNENKSKVMLVSRRKRRGKKEIEIYVNNKKLQQVNSIKYLGTVFDSKMTFRDNINYIEEKCTKLIFTLAKSAEITGSETQSGENHLHGRNPTADIIRSASQEKCDEQGLL